jgi:hypothetical protein
VRLRKRHALRKNEKENQQLAVGCGTLHTQYYGRFSWSGLADDFRTFALMPDDRESIVQRFTA